MNKLKYLLLLLTIVSLSACQTGQTEGQAEQKKTHQEADIHKEHVVEEDAQKNQEETVQKDKEEADTNEKETNAEEKEKLVTLGIAGYEEEMKFLQYKSSWLSIWYPPGFELLEEKKKIRFQGPEEVYFEVEQVEKVEDDEKRIAPYLEQGYELLNRFSLENQKGVGYIFYSYEKRQSIDVYYVGDGEATAKVEFMIIDGNQHAEKLIMQFEYMLKTIELLS